jgi:WD40 repeat protein
LRYYDFKKSTLVKRLETPLKTLAISPDNTYLIGGSVSGKIVRINTSDWKEDVIFEEEGALFHAVEISPDGKYLAFGDEEGQAHIWDLKQNIEINVLRGHTARINDIEFSPDSEMIATGSYDGSIQLYGMGKLDELPIIMRDHEEYVWDLSFSYDGQYIVAATQNDIIKIWPTQSDYFAKDLCENLSGDMSVQDWARYVPNGVNYETTCASYNNGGGSEEEN